MRFAVLSSPSSWYLADLRRAAGAEHEVTDVTFRELGCGLLGERDEVTSAGRSLLAFDGVLVRTMPPGSLEQVVFRMDALARLEAAGGVVVNPARAIETAVDKFLASAKLRAAGLLTPRTIACQTVDDAMAAFEALGRDVVVKPLFGSEGRGLTRLTDDGLAERAFQLLVSLGAVLYVQEFIDHAGYDYRALVIGQRVLCMKRSNPGDWRTNCSRGATAEPVALPDELLEMARRGARAIGAPLAGVDFLPDRHGRVYTIEVNAVPGWRALAGALRVDVAKLVLDELAARARAQRGASQ